MLYKNIEAYLLSYKQIKFALDEARQKYCGTMVWQRQCNLILHCLKQISIVHE